MKTYRTKINHNAQFDTGEHFREVCEFETGLWRIEFNTRDLQSSTNGSYMTIGFFLKIISDRIKIRAYGSA
jgi:hypothetical protein